MTTVLVAERFNMPTRPAFVGTSPRRWYAVARRLGCFRKGNGAERLRSLGLEWDLSLNLTPPAPQGVAFDSDFAQDVAQALVDDAWDWAGPTLRLVLVGKRVPRAFLWRTASFGMRRSLAKVREVEPPADPRTRTTLYLDMLCVPHPSGLSHWWNDPDRVDAMREHIEETWRCSTSP